MNVEFQIENGVLSGYSGSGGAEVKVPEGVAVIGAYAFARCDSITSVIIPEGVKSIGECAFMGCEWLRAVTLPSTLETIGAAAFRECDSLEEIRLPAQIRVLPTACFYECISLKSVQLPEGLVRIGSKAFSGCRRLESIELPPGAEEIEEFAFEYCTGLKRAVMPPGFRTIGRHAFASCHQLSEVIMPDTVTEIGSSAFYQTAFMASPAEMLTAGDGILLSCREGPERIQVPEGVKSIGELAFAYNSSVKSIILPPGVERICRSAFERCTALEEITLPDSLRVIDDAAFQDCACLSRIELPDGIEQIGGRVFDRTALASDPGTLILGGRYLIRYGGSEEDYTLPEGVTVIAGSAFSGSGIRTVRPGAGLKSICAEAFRWCPSLEEIYIPPSVSLIGSYAFAACEKLHAKIGQGRRMIGEGCFAEGQRLNFSDGDNEFTVTLLNDITAGSPEHALMGFAAMPSPNRFPQLSYAEYLIPAAACYAGEGGIYTEYLRRNIVAAVRFSVDIRDSGLTRQLLDLGQLTERQAAECAAYAIEQKAFEQQLLIMRSKQQSFGSADDKLIDDKFDW